MARWYGCLVYGVSKELGHSVKTGMSALARIFSREASEREAKFKYNKIDRVERQRPEKDE
jgi:hypothetical protein